MRFFKRKKKEESLEKDLEKDFDEYIGNVLMEQDRKDLRRKDSRTQDFRRKADHYVINCLEQIIETTKEIEEEKGEYRVVTAYLNDIHTIEGLSEDERENITESARNIVSLNQARDEFLHMGKKITDVQYTQMQQEEDNIPTAINRLKSNEAYRDTVNKDLKYLQRERDEWELRRDHLIQEQKRLQNAIFIVIGLAISAMMVLFIFQIVTKISLQLAWTIIIFCIAAGICLISLRLTNAKSEYRTAEASIKRAIVLQNKVKIKYVNITNAIDYSCEKYHVSNSGELNKVWKSYLEAVKQREKFERNNEDLKYYSDRLIRQLSRYKLYDAKVWIPQAPALADHKEMVEVTHNLNERRQKLRERIEYSMEMVKRQKEDVERLMQTVDKDMRPQIQEIIDSVDKLSGA